MERIGPFEIQRELGRGALGVVYEGRDLARGLAVAVKLYGAGPPAALARVRRDALAAGALGHPNLAAVLGAGGHEGALWVATELVGGVSLGQVVKSRTAWPVERILDVWRQLCEGLAHAHREGLLHLDLKPTDVRVTPTGEVKVLDFGAWHLKSIRPQSEGPLDEALRYRPPEVLAGRRPDRRTDIFAVGALVYELLARRRAFPGDSVTDIIRLVSLCDPDLATLPMTAFTPGLEAVLARSLAREVKDRHPYFEDVHADLVRLVEDAVPRLRQASAAATASPEREALWAQLTRARTEDRLEDALGLCRRVLAASADDQEARRAQTEIESVLVEREVDVLVGKALAHAADHELDEAAAIAERIERLAPWSPRYLQLQVYLDEERARLSAAGEATPDGPVAAPAPPAADAAALTAAALKRFVEGDHAGARDRAKQALSLDPNQPRARDLLKILDARGGKP